MDVACTLFHFFGTSTLLIIGMAERKSIRDGLGTALAGHDVCVQVRFLSLSLLLLLTSR